MLEKLRNVLRTAVAKRLRVPEIPFALERLKRQGFVPSKIADVGAYRGDFAAECLTCWPAAEIICFEPQQKMLPALRALAARHPNVKIQGTLLGAAPQQGVVLNCAETGSSVLTEHHMTHPTTLCDQKTLDMAVNAGSAPANVDLLKIDVQGYELEVLKGAAATLTNVGVLLLELNLIDIHRGVPLIAELVRWLDQRHLVAFDVCGLTRRPLDDALWQVDMIFVPRESKLRVDKRWQR